MFRAASYFRRELPLPYSHAARYAAALITAASCRNSEAAARCITLFAASARPLPCRAAFIAYACFHAIRYAERLLRSSPLMAWLMPWLPLPRQPKQTGYHTERRHWLPEVITYISEELQTSHRASAAFHLPDNLKTSDHLHSSLLHHSHQQVASLPTARF